MYFSKHLLVGLSFSTPSAKYVTETLHFYPLLLLSKLKEALGQHRDVYEVK